MDNPHVLNHIFTILPSRNCCICYENILDYKDVEIPECCNSIFHSQCLTIYINMSNPVPDCPYCGTGNFKKAEIPLKKYMLSQGSPVIKSVYQYLLSSNTHRDILFDCSLRKELGCVDYCKKAGGIFSVFDIHIKCHTNNQIYSYRENMVVDPSCFYRRFEEFTYGIFDASFSWDNIIASGIYVAAAVCVKNYHYIKTTDPLTFIIYNSDNNIVQAKTKYLLEYISSRLPESIPYMSIRDRTILINLKGIIRPIRVELVSTDYLYMALFQSQYGWISLNQIMYDGLDVKASLNGITALRLQQAISVGEIHDSLKQDLHRLHFNPEYKRDTGYDISVHCLEPYIPHREFVGFEDTPILFSTKINCEVTTDIDNFIQNVFNRYYLEIILNKTQSSFNKAMIQTVIEKINYINIRYKELPEGENKIMINLVNSARAIVIPYCGIITERSIKKFVLKHTETS